MLWGKSSACLRICWSPYCYCTFSHLILVPSAGISASLRPVFQEDAELEGGGSVVSKIGPVTPTEKVTDALEASVGHGVQSPSQHPPNDPPWSTSCMRHVTGKIHLSSRLSSETTPAFPMDPVVSLSSPQNPQNCLPLPNFMLLEGLRGVDEEDEAVRGVGFHSLCRGRSEDNSNIWKYNTGSFYPEWE